MTRSNNNYRTAVVEPTDGDSIREAHSYEYDNNGNIVYVNTSRVKPDMTTQPDTVQRAREEKFRWDEENRLTALSQNVTKECRPLVTWHKPQNSIIVRKETPDRIYDNYKNSPSGL